MLAICLSSKQNSSELLGGVSHYLLKESLLTGKNTPRSCYFSANND